MWQSRAETLRHFIAQPHPLATLELGKSSKKS